MPAGKVAVSATFAPEKTAADYFADVPANSYYADAVLWAAKNGITGGIGNGLFGPNQPCTRAQIVTFLWRAAGSPEPKSMSSFSDVSADSYYAKAVAWRWRTVSPQERAMANSVLTPLAPVPRA